MIQFNKFSLFLWVAIFFAGTGFAQHAINSVDANPAPVKEPKIEQFWFVLLKTGPKKDFDSATRAKLFEGHMANITRLYYEGILKAAGPFGKNDLAWRGIFVFDCKTKEEAQKLFPRILQ